MKKIKFLSLTLITSLIFSTMPVSANTQYTDSTQEVINVDTPISNDSNSNCEVYAEIKSEFKVTIPKHITLDGTTKKGSYNVSVEGDIAGKEVVKVIPDETVLLNSKNKPSITGTIIQDKIKWNCNEILSNNNVVGNGTILAQNLTAGSWNGTFNFNISLSECTITVTAKNESGENLNASSNLIEGKQRKYLINGLIESGLIDAAEDVDALIDVNSDDFDGLAETTFNVFSIANPGDEIIILHYDEKIGEWEFISKEIVDENGRVVADFSSYSPVAFIKPENTEHTHQYTETVQEPTCTEDGEKLYECSCGDKYTEIITALGHNFDDWVEIKNSSCTQNGQKQRTCLSCGIVETSDLDLLSHSWDDKFTIDIDATCTKNGLKSIHCLNCSATKDSEIVEATGHTEIIDSAILPTCTSTGLTEGKHCDICNEILTKQEVIPMLEHSYTSSITKEATCTEEGNKKYSCSNCSHSYYEVIAIKGHVYNSTQYVTDIPATCEADGSKSVHCNICNAKITGTETIIPKTGHNYGTTYSTSGTQHWKTCFNGCNTIIELANHSDSGTDGLCDTCGYKGTIIYTYHTHDGNSSNGTGCYTLANYTTCGTYSTKVYNTCSSCNGSGNGSYVSGYYDDCSSCGGSGNGTYHSGYYNDCTNCNGSGSVSSTTGCSTCNSTGTITTTSTSSCGNCGGDGKVSSSSTSSCPEPDCERGQVLTYYKCDSCGYYNDISEYTWNNSECTKCGYDSTSDIYSTCSTCGGDDKVTTTTTSSCKNCGGDGKVSSSSSKKCTSCGGDGQVSSTSNCSKCNGSGNGSYVSGYYDDCSSCGGDGQGSWISGYYENCSTCGGDGKTTIKHYKCTGCSATSSTSGGTHKYISSYSINCGKTTSTIESQYTEFK